MKMRSDLRKYSSLFLTITLLSITLLPLISYTQGHQLESFEGTYGTWRLTYNDVEDKNPQIDSG